MKKIFLVVVAVAFFATQGIAQDFNFGVKGGVNFTNLTGDDVDADMKTKFNLGVLAEFMVNEQFSIQPEVLYSAQGADEDNTELTLDYITVPVMFKYYVAPGFSLQAGPQVGFLVNDDYEASLGDVSVSPDTDDVFKTVDFGLNFGLGYKFYNNIFVDARYNLGLTEVFDEGDVDAKNSVIQFSVGYMF
ncbi:outer membrane protein with beta-barrel domain [Balneicella halophila]|uniref:Outer membrane protein with beta-barrel domain n=1 Tax=Balneicella halophila TaxID=1537566 RepID=A0A7L4UMU2_BALHA|nr:porin family protein [Balneicella halophila]PVX49944.1 outer membrane protein with beta-barrel domain [Balneicella halophila]